MCYRPNKKKLGTVSCSAGLQTKQRRRVHTTLWGKTARGRKVLQNSWMEIRRELNVSWTATKEKHRLSAKMDGASGSRRVNREGGLEPNSGLENRCLQTRRWHHGASVHHYKQSMRRSGGFWGTDSLQRMKRTVSMVSMWSLTVRAFHPNKQTNGPWLHSWDSFGDATTPSFNYVTSSVQLQWKTDHWPNQDQPLYEASIAWLLVTPWCRYRWTSVRSRSCCPPESRPLCSRWWSSARTWDTTWLAVDPVYKMTL